MKQKRFLLSFLTLLLSTIMYVQQEITGTVTDSFGPVIGAKGLQHIAYPLKSKGEYYIRCFRLLSSIFID